VNRYCFYPRLSENIGENGGYFFVPLKLDRKIYAIADHLPSIPDGGVRIAFVIGDDQFTAGLFRGALQAHAYGD